MYLKYLIYKHTISTYINKIVFYTQTFKKVSTTPQFSFKIVNTLNSTDTILIFKITRSPRVRSRWYLFPIKYQSRIQDGYWIQWLHNVIYSLRGYCTSTFNFQRVFSSFFIYQSNILISSSIAYYYIVYLIYYKKVIKKEKKKRRGKKRGEKRRGEKKKCLKIYLIPVPTLYM